MTTQRETAHPPATGSRFQPVTMGHSPGADALNS